MGKIHLITGSDEYAIKNKARQIIVSLCGEDPEGNPCLEIIHGDSGDMKPEQLVIQIIRSVATPAFMGSAKTIWFKNFDFEKFDVFKDSKKLEKLMDEFLELLKAGLHDDTTLIMSVFSVDKRSSFYKACQKTAEIVFLDKVDIMSKDWNDKLRSVIYDTCRKNGVKISEDAVAFVSETAGVDVGRVQSEIEKLTAYVSPASNITLADCRKICSRTPETAGWSFSNALAERNLREAIDTLNVFSNMDPKKPEMKIIYAVMGNFQDMIKIKAAAQKLSVRPRAQYNEFSARLQDVSPELKMSMKDGTIFKLNPFRAWKIFQSSENFTDQELAVNLSEILRVNRALVSGAVAPIMELEALAVKICSRRASK
ncbi:MAG TPA: hypothetical protein DCZ94_19810 [Lentisphaeria bacterium]|nr:MAG: hypothetical protein A2X48_22355 [Lentisphaerae bacterium GWF2_49_21]HBC89192.1 hypothetical protein [Lentisphaeria bacterium]